MKLTSFYSLSYENLYKELEGQGLNPYGARVLYNWFYKKREVGSFPEDLAKDTLNYLVSNFSFDLPKVLKNQEMVQNNTNATKKFLIQFADDRTVECVLIPFYGKYTLCLSSQVGCAMKCSFCYTGKQGLTRQLSTDEIVGQLMSVHKWLKEEADGPYKISNIVFMGQGEPLHNFSSVKKACDIFLSQYGLSIGRDKITISTAGYLPGLLEWKKSDLRVNLALSLHSTKKEIRDELIPLNRPYPLDDILAFLKSWPLDKKKFITFEYLMIKDLNDHEEDAHELGEVLSSFKAIINLIPFNPIPGSSYKRPLSERVDRFNLIIESFGIPCMVRKTKGDEILAACGQLNSKAKDSLSRDQLG